MTLLGMAVVDVQHWDRSKRHGYMMRPVAGFDDDNDEFSVKEGSLEPAQARTKMGDLGVVDGADNRLVDAAGTAAVAAASHNGRKSRKWVGSDSFDASVHRYMKKHRSN